MYRIRTKSLSVARGFTLVEVMIVAALAGAFFFALASVYVLVDDSWNRGSSLVNLQRDGSYALVEMTSTIRSGATAEVPQSTRLVIKDEADSTLGQYYWQLSDKTLRDLSGAKVVPSLVDSLHFALSGEMVFVTLVLTDSDAQRALFSTAASLRN